MSLTLSSMLPLGTLAPDFNLPNTITGQSLSLEALKSSTGTVIMFICNHCPFVKHVLPQILKIAHEYGEKGISFVAISANDPITHPEDGPQQMAEMAKAHNFPFPYLFDETQEVAKAYQAECTPDFFVFDSALRCVYRGQLDDSHPSKDIAHLTGLALRTALNCLISGNPIDPDQKPSMGCNIKWKD